MILRTNTASNFRVEIQHHADAVKRRCAVTNKRVYTWAVVTPSPVPIPYAEQRPIVTAVQEALRF